MEFSATYGTSVREKPCLEDINEMEFIPNKEPAGTLVTVNTLFGPVNNRYKRKTDDELKNSPVWNQLIGWDFERYCIDAVNDLRNTASRVSTITIAITDLTDIISNGRPKCKSNDLEDLLYWFDDQSYLINAVVDSSFTTFKKNLKDILEFEEAKEDMINK